MLYGQTAIRIPPYVLMWHPSWQWPRHPQQKWLYFVSHSLVPLFQKAVVYSFTSLLLFSAVAILLQPDSSPTPGHHRRPPLFQSSGEIDTSSCKQSPITPLPPFWCCYLGFCSVLAVSIFAGWRSTRSGPGFAIWRKSDYLFFYRVLYDILD